MATLATKPSNILSIKYQKVTKAYLAEKEITGSEKSGEHHSYTFKGNNNTADTARKKRIAKIIYDNIKPTLDKQNQATTKEEVEKALTQDSYKKGDCVEIPLIKPIVKFNKLTTANLGKEVYIVIQTEHMQEREIKMNLKQGKEKVFTDVEEPIYVTQDGQAKFKFTAVVGEFSKEKTVANADDFIDYAIAKIKLGSTNSDKNKEYENALKKTKEGKTYLFIAMDAEPEDQNWFEVKYEEIFDNRPNLWYYGEGNWFEIEKAGLLFPFKSIPLNHPEGFKNDNYKPYDYTLHETKAPTFGYKRGSSRIHAARDLYYEIGEPIYAIDDGVVKNVYSFYYDTWAIEIEHEYEYKSGYKLYVRYGEVSKNNIKVKKGDIVKKGDKIAEIGLLVPNIMQPGTDKRGMLHIEMYTGEAKGNLTNKTIKYSEMMYAKSSKYSKNRSFQRRKDLIDPLPLLKEMFNNSKAKKIIK
ncbi:M23 family metallopeptidase [Aquimarina rhabdastrellae]